MQQTTQMGGDGIWNRDAWYGEGATLDTVLGAHPQQDGQYHSHARPTRLYESTPSTQHSPIIGWSYDGYPIYGPYGYSDPNDANSSVKQIMSSYQLRNITERHELPDGTVLQATEYGPDVSNDHPLGEFGEDYEYVANSGDLDEFNGRTTVTPEFPNGTYAYFTTLTTSGDPAYPYYLALEYYGDIDMRNVIPNQTITIPNGVLCVNPLTSVEEPIFGQAIQIAPNPAATGFKVLTGTLIPDAIEVSDLQGRVLRRIEDINVNNVEISTENWSEGIYLVTVQALGQSRTQKLIVR